MTASQLKGWTGVCLDAWRLGFDASSVIAMRVAKIAGGGDAGAAEARLMVAEKVQAALQLQAKLVDDVRGTPLSSTQTALRHYGKAVAANRRRLSR